MCLGGRETRSRRDEAQIFNRRLRSEFALRHYRCWNSHFANFRNRPAEEAVL